MQKVSIILAVVVVDSVVVVEFVISAVLLTWFVRSCIFWRLEKISLFYDPVISHAQLLGQDFVVHFATSMRVCMVY